jgi:hypothetical protein
LCKILSFWIKFIFISFVCIACLNCIINITNLSVNTKLCQVETIEWYVRLSIISRKLAGVYIEWWLKPLCLLRYDGGTGAEGRFLFTSFFITSAVVVTKRLQYFFSCVVCYIYNTKTKKSLIDRATALLQPFRDFFFSFS